MKNNGIAVLLILLLLLTNCSKTDMLLKGGEETNAVENTEAANLLSGSNASAAAGERMRISGKGYYNELYGTIVSFAFNAVQKKDGSITGHLAFEATFITVKATLDCIRMEDNLWILSGVITHSKGIEKDWILPGYRWQIAFEDNGDGDSGTPDRMSGFGFGGKYLTCNEEGGINRATPNEIIGNVQVKKNKVF